MDSKTLEPTEDFYIICASCFSLNVDYFECVSYCSHCKQDGKGTLIVTASEILNCDVKSKEEVNPETIMICTRCYCREFETLISNGHPLYVCSNCRSVNFRRSVKLSDVENYSMIAVTVKEKVIVCRTCKQPNTMLDRTCTSCRAVTESVEILKS